MRYISQRKKRGTQIIFWGEEVRTGERKKEKNI